MQKPAVSRTLTGPARPNEEVSEDERQYEDGSDPQVLDLVDLPLLTPRPKTYQSENWLLDPDQYWTRAGRMSWKDAGALADDPPRLWVNESSTGAGLNDRVELEAANALTASLYLLWLPIVALRVFAPGAYFGDTKRRVQARFTHRGTEYRLRVTDPLVERDYKAKGEGDYSLEDCLATISLGEPFKGYCYKLVATLITP